MDCSPRSRRAESFSHRMLESIVPTFSRFMSTMNTLGILQPSMRFLMREISYLPAFVL